MDYVPTVQFAQRPCHLGEDGQPLRQRERVLPNEVAQRRVEVLLHDEHTVPVPFEAQYLDH